MLLYRMMYSFRMPLFMFTSGFLMVFTTIMRRGSASPSLSRFTLKKIERLLIPFVTLSLVTFIPRVMLSGMADDSVELSATSFWQMFVYGADKAVIPYFWFIQSSFTLLVVNYALLKLTEKWIPAWITQLLLVLCFAVLPLSAIEWTTIFSLNETVRLSLYFALGGLYAICRQRVDDSIPWHKTWFFFLAAALWIASFFLFEKTDYIPVCSVMGIMMCISGSKILEYRKWDFLDHLTGANYMIFLLSWYCNVLSQQVLSHFVTIPWWVHTLLSLFSGIYLPWLAYRYLREHSASKTTRVFSFLLGQRFKNKG